MSKGPYNNPMSQKHKDAISEGLKWHHALRGVTENTKKKKKERWNALYRSRHVQTTVWLTIENHYQLKKKAKDLGYRSLHAYMQDLVNNSLP